MGLLPFLRLVLKLRHAPAEMHLLEASPMSRGKKVFHLRGNDDIAAARLVQIVDESPAKVARVGKKSNSGTGNLRRNLLQTSLHHESGPGVTRRVPGSQGTVP